jgi:hypothetical protein
MKAFTLVNPLRVRVCRVAVTSTPAKNFLLGALVFLKPGGHKEMSSILADQKRPTI